MGRGRAAESLVSRFGGYAGERAVLTAAHAPRMGGLARRSGIGRAVTRTSRKLPVMAARDSADLAKSIERMQRVSAGRISRKTAAKYGKYAAGGVVAAGAIGTMRNRRRSGLDPVKGRPTGPYMY